MENKINVLHIVSSLSKKGPVQVIYDLMKNSDFSKFRFVLLSLRLSKSDSLLKDFQELPIKIIQLDDIMAFNFWKFNQIVLNLIESEKINVCHSHCTRSLIINSISCKQVRQIHSVQIYPGLQSYTMNGYFKGSFINFITKKLLRTISFPVSCSKYVHDELLNIDNIPTHIIVNGSSSKFKFDEGISRFNMQRKLGLDPSFRYIISVGRLSPEKNFFYLIDIFLKAKLSNFKLIIVGDGPLEKKLKDFADDNILILGFKSNFEEYIFASDFYISTSLTEGMPLSVLVAMELGRPLLLSNIHAHKEIFDSANDYNLSIGCLIDLTNNFIELGSLINSLDYELCKNNVKFVYNNCYNTINMASLYNKFYTYTLNKI